MAYTEVTEEGWFSRIGNSIKGILFGIIIFVLGFPLLFWNEGRAVHRAQSLTEGKGAVVSVESTSVDQGNDGKLIHTTGKALTEETLTDDTFQVSAEKAIKLKRVVEMYQWQENETKETTKKAGGKTVTKKTYTYEKVWSGKNISSGNFKEQGHDNPGNFPFEAQSWKASKVTLGAFTLPPSLVESIGGEKTVNVDEDDLPSNLKSKVSAHGEGFYVGKDPSNPEIGDVRITFKAVYPADVSVIGVQTGDTLKSYTAKKGGSTIFELDMGTRSAEDMFTALEQQNAMLTWVLRVVGFLMLFLGLRSVFAPLVVVADVIPFIGNLLDTGIGIVCFMIAAPLALITIAIGWIAYRPLLGIALLVAAGAIGFGIFTMVKKKKEG